MVMPSKIISNFLKIFIIERNTFNSDTRKMLLKPLRHSLTKDILCKRILKCLLKLIIYYSLNSGTITNYRYRKTVSFN